MGDVPTWVAAVAAWAGVVVNAAIVLVALSPIRTAKREREARGRLVAAYLMIPIGTAYKLMFMARGDLRELIQPNAMLDGTALDGVLNRLQGVCDRVPSLLASFNLSEAAYLDEGMGEVLAQAIGTANATVSALSLALARLAVASRFPTMDQVRAAQRTEIEKLGFLPAQFESASDLVGIFAQYCEGLFTNRETIAAMRN